MRMSVKEICKLGMSFKDPVVRLFVVFALLYFKVTSEPRGVDAKFNPNDHPRKKNGQFGKGSGNTETKKRPEVTPAERARLFHVIDSNPNMYKGRAGEECMAFSGDSVYVFTYDPEGGNHKINGRMANTTRNKNKIKCLIRDLDYGG